MGETKKKIGEMFVGKNNLSELYGGIILMIIVIIIVLLVGEYIWNDVLVKVTTIFKPIKSVWQLIAIIFLVRLIFC